MAKLKERPAHYKIVKLANEMEEKGFPVIHLEFGDPEITVHHDIIYSMYLSALAGHTHYSNPQGLDEFRTRLSEYMNERLGLDTTRENISVTLGSKSAIYMSFRAVAENNDTVLLVSPIWGLYHAMLDEMNIKYINYKTRFESKWRLTDEDINFILENYDFKAIAVNNPNNPTSIVWDPGDIDKVVELAREKNAYVIADEVYLDFSKKKFYSFLNTGYDRVIALFSFSKSYAMTGFRLGYVIASKEMASLISRLLQLYFTNVPEFIQFAGLKALELPWIVEENRKILWERTEFLSRELKNLGFIFHEPEGAFYIFAKHPNFNDGTLFTMNLIRKKYVSLAPGEAFGGYKEFVRFSASGNIEKLRVAVQRIREFMRGI